MEPVKTYTAQIFVGLQEGYDGPTHSISVVYGVCATYVEEVKLCVTVTPTSFFYVGDEEPGAIVGLISYPRFPTTEEEIRAKAFVLAQRLKAKLRQLRVTIVFTDRTVTLGEKE